MIYHHIKLTSKHSIRTCTACLETTCFSFRCSLGGSPNEHVWSGPYWSPPDVTSRGACPQVWCLEVGGEGRGYPTWPYHMTYPMMHLMLPILFPWTGRRLLKHSFTQTYLPAVIRKSFPICNEPYLLFNNKVNIIFVFNLTMNQTWKTLQRLGKWNCSMKFQMYQQGDRLLWDARLRKI